MMKTHAYLLATTCLLFPLRCFAQSTIAIQGGMHFSDITTRGNVFTTLPETKFFLGLNNRTLLRKSWALHTEVQYIQRGYHTGPRARGESIKIDYVDLSSKIEYILFHRIGLMLGAYGGYRLGEYTKGSAGWIKHVSPNSPEWDTGVQAGAIFHINRLAVFAHYSHGLKMSGEFTGVTPQGVKVTFATIYNNGLQIGLRYQMFNW